jgi:hypothetical protein
MRIRTLAFASIFLAAFGSVATADEAPAGKKVLVDISGFCGQWQIIKPRSDPAQKTADISHCTPAPAADFAALNCEVEIPVGSHQLQIKGMRSYLIFNVDSGGNVEVEKPHAGVMADGGKGILNLHLAKPRVDKAGFIGAGGFEHVAWIHHPDKDCNEGDRWAATPRGSTFMLTPTQALITSDHQDLFHSDRTTSVTANHADVTLFDLVYKTARVLVYPDKGAESVPWLVWESEASNNEIPGQREVVLIRDNTFQFRASGSQTNFTVTADCKAEPATIRAGNATFRLLAMCD